MVVRNRAETCLDGAGRSVSSGEASRVATGDHRLFALQVCASLKYGCVPYDAKMFSCAYADKRVWRLRPPLRPSASNEFASLIRLNFLAILENGPLSAESPPARGGLNTFVDGTINILSVHEKGCSPFSY